MQVIQKNGCPLEDHSAAAHNRAALTTKASTFSLSTEAQWAMNAPPLLTEMQAHK